MRCVILSTSIYLLMVFVGCQSNKDEVFYIYKVYDMDGKYKGHTDTLSYNKTGDSTFIVTVYMHGTKKELKCRQTSYIKLISPDKEAVLYNINDDSIYVNPEGNGRFQSPYLVLNSQYEISKEFYIDNKKEWVSMFRVDNFSWTEFVLYSPNYGFIFYTEGDNYRRLADIINIPDEEKQAALKLVENVQKDSSFFPYPVKTKIEFKAPHRKEK